MDELTPTAKWTITQPWRGIFGPLKGATIMLIFGLGTLPAMLGIGLSISQLSLRVRSSLYRLAAMLVVLVGIQLALRGLALNGQVAHAAIGRVMLW